MLTCLQIENLAPSVTLQDLLDLFAQCGPVEKIWLTKGSTPGQSPGSARVIMGSKEGFALAVQKWNGFSLHGLRISVLESSMAQPCLE